MPATGHDPRRDPARRGVPARARPRDRQAGHHRGRARRPPPDRPSRARPRDAGPRGDPAGRADRPALPARLPGAVHRLWAAARRRHARPPGRRHRPAPGGASWVQTRRRGLTAGPVSGRLRGRCGPAPLPFTGARVRRPARPIADDNDTRSPRPHGCTQATRLACPPGRASRAPRDRPAQARGVFALPRDEAAASRLPELRLLPGPPGGPAEAASERQATSPLADQVTPSRPVPSEAGPTGIRVAVDAMGGDHGPAEVVPGALDHARAHPEDRVILVGDEATVRPGSPAPCRPTSRSSTRARSSAWTSIRRWPCARRRTPRSSSPSDLVKRGEADAVVTAGHTGRRHGRRGPAPRPPARRRPARPGRPDDHRLGSLVLLDIGANPDSTPENLAQYARMGAIFAERVLGVAEPRVALLSIGEEKGKGDARIQRATELLDASGLQLRRQRRGQGPDAPPGRRRRLRRGPGQRRDQVLRGPLDLHLRPVAGRVPAVAARPARVPADAAGHRPDPEVFDYEKVGGSPLLGVRGTVIITHGRAKRRMIGFRLRGGGQDGPDPRPGAHRGGPRGRPGGWRATVPRGHRPAPADPRPPEEVAT